MTKEVIFDVDEYVKFNQRAMDVNPFKELNYYINDGFIKGSAAVLECLNISNKKEILDKLLTNFNNKTSDQNKRLEDDNAVETLYKRLMDEKLKEIYDAIDSSKEGQESPIWDRNELNQWVDKGAKAAIETICGFDSFSQIGTLSECYLTAVLEDKTIRGKFDPMEYFNDINN